MDLWDTALQTGCYISLMDRFNRIYLFNKLLRAHFKPVSLAVIKARLEYPPAAAKRLIRFIRDYPRNLSWITKWPSERGVTYQSRKKFI